ncbi:inosose dehydratase [Veronia nyctiphanis]|uniref:Inosose dehydratase n=1 Tax=Veronia nyctiphanis TaxID=1278244 RepID=A0A4Q0YUX9_9GAMM|nr:TIM barrel protein [Veronia nyctiphanis]RXJ74645.1 inosose dehydratase [Veronia nyctiphanis]
MELNLANAPCSWGIEFADNPENPPWNQVLREMSLAGYKATELGPLGYLPTDGGKLSTALKEQQLKLIAGTLFDYLHKPEERKRILQKTETTCRILKEQGAEFLVVIDHVSSPRTDEAGQKETATRLDDARWSEMMFTLKRVGEICNANGITATLHPHAGTYIEYEDEVIRAMDELPASLISLCVDTGHCVYAGMDPADVIKRYRDRVRYLHFKDIQQDVHAHAVKEGIDFYNAIGQNIFCPLGEGCVDFSSVKQALNEINFTGWVTVEQDTDPAAKNDVQTDAEKSRVFIENTILA